MSPPGNVAISFWAWSTESSGPGSRPVLCWEGARTVGDISQVALLPCRGWRSRVEWSLNTRASMGCLHAPPSVTACCDELTLPSSLYRAPLVGRVGCYSSVPSNDYWGPGSQICTQEMFAEWMLSPGDAGTQFHFFRSWGRPHKETFGCHCCHAVSIVRSLKPRF